MNKLDQKILELFRYLINTGTKYLSRIDYKNHKLLYKVDGKEVSLNMYHTTKGKNEINPNSYSTLDTFSKNYIMSFSPYWDVIINTSEGELYFSLTIEEKTYNIPELTRVEQAQTLDKIESILEKKESEILDSVLNGLIGNSCEEF